MRKSGRWVYPSHPLLRPQFYVSNPPMPGMSEIDFPAYARATLSPSRTEWRFGKRRTNKGALGEAAAAAEGDVAHAPQPINAREGKHRFSEQRRERIPRKRWRRRGAVYIERSRRPASVPPSDRPEPAAVRPPRCCGAGRSAPDSDIRERAWGMIKSLQAHTTPCWIRARSSTRLRIPRSLYGSGRPRSCLQSVADLRHGSSIDTRRR